MTVLEQPEKLMQVLASRSDEETTEGIAIAEAFELRPELAEAVLDLQVRRFTPIALMQPRQELAETGRGIIDATSA